VAYVTLMTDTYPPFRLDQGGAEPGPRPPSPTDRPTGADAAVPAPRDEGDVSAQERTDPTSDVAPAATS